MNPRLTTIGLVTLLVVTGCTSGGSGPGRRLAIG
jgi:hypothetical protein